MEKSQRGCGAYVGRQQKVDPDRLWGDGTLGGKDRLMIFR